MDTLLQSQIFFFISSIGFVILWVLVVVAFFRLICAINIFSRIMRRVERDIDNIGDTTKEMFKEMRDSSFFHFFFGRKRKKNHKGL